MHVSWRLLALAALVCGLVGCDNKPDSGKAPTPSDKAGDASGETPATDGDKKPQVAYVTNGVASFWTIAEVGAKRGAEEFNADCDVRMPTGGVADQKRIIEDLLARGVEGIAISPIEPDNQTQSIDEACEHAKVITHDSDAPNTKRLCYIGMSNYDAGRMCGELVKEALPDGGSIMIFVGRLGQLNADLRRQGLIDALLDRSHDPSRRDPAEAELKNDKYTILGTKIDGGLKPERTKANAEDTITNYPDINCMVGLFAYNPPACLEAIRGAGKLGQIKVVGFDEADETLQGIKDGNVQGTVVQNPFEYGRQSVKVLAALVRGDNSVIPEGGFIDIPARKITAENVDEFWTELKTNLGTAAK